MASVWRTSSPGNRSHIRPTEANHKFSRSIVDMDHEYTSNTWPHSFEKNSAEVNCRPYDSRRRRLFPHRRPSIPIPISRNVTATSDSSLLASSPSRDDSLIDHQDIDSTTSSPRSVDSVATVNVRVISTSERPFSGTDPRVWEDARFCTPYLASSPPRSCSIGCPIQAHNASSKSMETSFSAPLYTDTPARGNLQWKSMAQFHTFGRRVRPRDRQSREVTARTSLVPIAVRQDWSGEEYEHMLGRVESSPNVPALEIASWDCTVKLSTVVTVADSGRLHIHHLAVLSVIMPKGKLHAERVNLSVLVANAFRYDQKRSLGPGQSSLLFQEDVSQTGFFPRGGVGLVIERDSCDLEKPLNLYFAFKYPSPHHFVMASLPTFRPKGGRSLSEVVFIAEPLPPLSLRTFTRDPLSSWKLYDHPVNQVTCYERIGLPQLYPAACQDDIQMSILELDPVRFGAIRESNLSSMVWNLDITIHKDLEEQLECRMSFFLEVGPATVLVSLVPHGWVPGYFIVDGRVATEKSGECWKNKEGQITISKTSRMTPGPIMVGTVWQGPPQTRKHDGVSNSRPLPQIVDRKMLGGRLTCGSDESECLLRKPLYIR